MTTTAHVSITPLKWCTAHDGPWRDTLDAEYPDGWCRIIDRYEWHLRGECRLEEPPAHFIASMIR